MQVAPLLGDTNMCWWYAGSGNTYATLPTSEAEHSCLTSDMAALYGVVLAAFLLESRLDFPAGAAAVHQAPLT